MLFSELRRGAIIVCAKSATIESKADFSLYMSCVAKTSEKAVVTLFSAQKLNDDNDIIIMTTDGHLFMTYNAYHMLASVWCDDYFNEQNNEKLML